MPDFRFAELKPDPKTRERLKAEGRAAYDALHRALDYPFFPAGKEPPGLEAVYQDFGAKFFFPQAGRQLRSFQRARRELEGYRNLRGLLDAPKPSPEALVAVKNLGHYLVKVVHRSDPEAKPTGRILYDLVLAKAVFVLGRWALERTHEKASLGERALKLLGRLPKRHVTSQSRHELVQKFETLMTHEHLPKEVRRYFQDAADNLSTY